MMSTKSITIVTCCMGRLGAAQKTLPSLAMQRCPVVFVDWSCPDRSGEWVMTEYPAFSVVQVKNKKHFHLCAAWNTGAKQVQTPYIAFLDVDMKLEKVFIAAVQGALAASKGYARFARRKGSMHGYSGFIALPTAVFRDVGGYDERLVGYGYDDDDLRIRLEHAGIPGAEMLDYSIATHMDHADVDRTAHYKNKNISDTYLRNMELGAKHKID